MSGKQSYWGVVLAGLLAALAGCEHEILGTGEGLHIGAHVAESTARSRLEAELVPNATLVREDTSPDWPLGRYAYTNGADRILVVTRITSYALVDKDDKPTGKRIDRDMERAWVTIPYDFPKGMPLSLEAQEAKFQVGYDKTPGAAVTGAITDEANQDKFFIEPNSIRGKVTVEEESVSSASVHVNIEVTPQHGPRWRFDTVMDVPVTTVGIWAKRAKPELIMIRGGRPNSPTIADTQPAETGAGTQPSDLANNGSTTRPAPRLTSNINRTAWPDAATSQPARTTAVLSATTTQPAAQKSLVGRWICQRTSADNFEYRFQFDANGTCVFTSQRPNYPPVPRYGTYEMKKDFVVINVQRGEPGVLRFPWVSLQVAWQGGTPVLRGDLLPDPGFQNRVIVLQQGNYMDMNAVLPKTN